jgi:biotin carboxyl carrier protein
MIKKLRVTVDGKSYDVSVEVPDDLSASAPVLAPSPSSPAPSPAPPLSAPASTPVAPSSAGPGEVRSPLAGRIIAINIQAGQEVKAGDHMLTVEAMKMNTSVTARRAGKVTEILTTVGAAVDEGQILARIEELK